MAAVAAVAAAVAVVGVVDEIYGLRHPTAFEVVLTSLHPENLVQLRLGSQRKNI